MVHRPMQTQICWLYSTDHHFVNCINDRNHLLFCDVAILVGIKQPKAPCKK